MMLLWTFQQMKERQLFWTAFCVLSLLENAVSADDALTLGTVSQTITTTVKPTSATNMSAADSLSSNATVTSAPVGAENSTSDHSEIKQNSSSSSSPAISATAASPTLTTEQTSSTQGNMSYTTSNETTKTWTTARPEISVSIVHTTSEVTRSSNTTSAGDSHVMITCINIKEKTSGKVRCLEPNETYTCEQFKEQKKEHLGKVFCATDSKCHIELTKSEIHNNCILLVGINQKGTDALDKILEENTHYLQKLGLKFHKEEEIESHKDYSRKTLIALVTSGLLLAFLGLAGYHLMKRRSWSPMGERLGEDPYYTDNGSHGNPAISVASHEQSDLQDKPNLNGGARENGTGQPTSKNGHSTRPHVVADTEL